MKKNDRNQIGRERDREKRNEVLRQLEREKCLDERQQRIQVRIKDNSLKNERPREKGKKL